MPDHRPLPEALEVLLDLVADILVVLDDEGCIRSVNAVAEDVLGLRPRDVLGREWRTFIHAGDRDRTGRFIAGLHERPGDRRALVARALDREGAPVPIRWTAMARDGCLYATGRDLTRERADAERVRRTEALWRASFEGAAAGMGLVTPEGVVADANPALCALLRTDRDALVGAPAAAFLSPGEEAEAMAGLGRVLRGEAERHDAERRLRRADGEVVRARVGVSLVVTPEGDRRLLAEVVELVEPAPGPAPPARDPAEPAALRRLRRALDAGRLLVHAQPIVDLRSGRTVGHELLVRMEEDGALVMPDRFLPAAERFGLIGEIDVWMAERAIGLARAGHAVSVNVSARSLAEAALLAPVERAVAGGLPGDRLCFEITETALADETDTVVGFARRADALGCRLAIDDFGVGYGGLLYLKQLAGLAATVKIDRSFVATLTSAEEDRRIVAAVADLARGLGLSVVAEGVEDRATVEELLRLGVPAGQGYLFGRPGPMGG